MSLKEFVKWCKHRFKVPINPQGDISVCGRRPGGARLCSGHCPEAHSHPILNGYPEASAILNAHSDPNFHCYAETNGNGHSEADSNPDKDGDPDPNAYSNGDPYSDGYPA